MSLDDMFVSEVIGVALLTPDPVPKKVTPAITVARKFSIGGLTL